jgi:hypothetical protein
MRASGAACWHVPMSTPASSRCWRRTGSTACRRSTPTAAGSMCRRWRAAWRSISARCWSCGPAAHPRHPHRVLGTWQERFSIPFFFEASVDAVIAPLPLPGAQPFAPFYFGDHLWEVTTRFVEQRGIAHLRTPRAATDCLPRLSRRQDPPCAAHPRHPHPAVFRGGRPARELHPRRAGAGADPECRVAADRRAGAAWSGRALFQRTRHGVALTERGSRLCPAGAPAPAGAGARHARADVRPGGRAAPSHWPPCRPSPRAGSCRACPRWPAHTPASWCISKPGPGPSCSPTPASMPRCMPAPRSRWPTGPAHVRCVLHEALVPVCAPALLPGGRAWSAAVIVAGMPLLQQSTRPLAWQQWFDSAQVSARWRWPGPGTRCSR